MSLTYFILHLDSLSILDKVSDEQAGKLLKAFYNFHLTNQIPNLDFALDLALTPFINQFKRDQIKYNNVVKRNQNNGLLGGRPKNPSEPKKPSGLSENPKNPSEPSLLSNKNRNSNSNKNNNNINTNEVITYFNKTFDRNLYQKGSTYKQIESYVKQIIKDGDTVDDIKLVIDYKKANPNTKKHLLESWINTKYFATNLNSAQDWHDNDCPVIFESQSNNQSNPMSEIIKENLYLINSGMFVPPDDYVESLDGSEVQNDSN